MFDEGPGEGRGEGRGDGPAGDGAGVPGGGAAGAGHGRAGDEWAGLDGVVAGLAALVGAAVGGVGDERLLGLAVQVEQARRLLDAAQAHLVGEIDARGCAEVRHGLPTAHWLAREASLPVRAARDRVRVARALRRWLPTADAALGEGRIGLDHVRTLVEAANPRIVAGFDTVVASLLDGLPATRFDAWRRQVLQVADLLDQDGAHDPRGDEPRSRLWLRPSGPAALELRGTLAGDDALLIEQALTPLVDELRRRWQRDQRNDPHLAVPGHAELLATACRSASRPRSRPATAAEVTVVLDAREPHPRLRPPDSSQLSVLPATHAERLLCDAGFVAVLIDSLGVPIDLGRGVRYATAAQRRALTARDGGCVFPGCDAPAAWCDAHHHRPWPDGGVTDLANLVSLCRRHHRLAHHPHWTLQLTPDGWSWWTTPAGTTFWSQRHGRQRPDPTPEPPGLPP